MQALVRFVAVPVTHQVLYPHAHLTAVPMSLVVAQWQPPSPAVGSNYVQTCPDNHGKSGHGGEPVIVFKVVAAELYLDFLPPTIPSDGRLYKPSI